MTNRLELFAIDNLPLLTEPSPLGPLLIDGLQAAGCIPQTGDVLVLAQKFASKAEGAFIDLDQVVPGERALELAEATGKDPRLVEVILSESSDLVRVVGGHIIAEHRLGYVCANAAVDMSNSGADSRAILLPKNPDATARALTHEIREHFGSNVAVIISDTHGRPFRNGAVGVAIGVAGINPLHSYRGEFDLDGRLLRTSQEAVGDELAAAASLLMGQGAEGCPLVVIRGYDRSRGDGCYRDLVRNKASDLFR